MSGARRPLQGVSVVVTRPASAGPDRLAGALAGAGARVLGVPAITREAPEDGGASLRAAAARVGDYRWVVLTSQHAVEQLFACPVDPRALRGVRIAAVGRATAAALAARGVPADLVPRGPSQGADGLAAAFPAAPASGGRVLFPRSAIARPALAAGLRAKGWAVEEVVAYSTVPAPAPPEDVVAAMGDAAAITFSSPSAIDAYLAMRTGSGRPLPLPPLVVCVGPVTARAARDAGLSVDLEVPPADHDAVVTGLARRLRLDPRGDAPASPRGDASASPRGDAPATPRGDAPATAGRPTTP